MGGFEGIQFPLAEHYSNIDAVKLQTYRAAWMNEVADWLGALGYTKEYPIEMGIRAISSFSIGTEGTMNIMKIIIA